MKDKQAELDLIFSRYMRLINSDENGYCKCFTCGRVLFWTEIEAGHWQKRKKLPKRYNLMNVKPQCVECNKFKNGEDKIFEENLVKMYGREAVDVLVFLSNKLVIKFDYDKWIKFYSELFKQEKEKRFGC
jgi:hypothetical protein